MTRSIEITVSGAVQLLSLLNSTDSFPDERASLWDVVHAYATYHLRDHGIYADTVVPVGLDVALTADYKGGILCDECRQFGEVLYSDKNWRER